MRKAVSALFKRLYEWLRSLPQWRERALEACAPEGDREANVRHAIAPSLAAILVLVISVTLVATQLAAQTYSPRVVQLRLVDPWLWGAVLLYLAAILWAMFSRGRLPFLGNKSALFVATVALLYLIPFTIATLHSLDPQQIAKALAARRMDAALDDMMRKAINDSLMSVLGDGLAALTEQVQGDLQGTAQVAGGHTKAGTAAGSRFRSIGRHASQQRKADALEAVQSSLSGVIKQSTARQWREAANILNGVAAELEDYALYQFGGGDQDVARLSLDQADRYVDIAEVQAHNDAPAADRETNLRRAIDGYRRALTFFTQTRYPAEFGGTQIGLGATYWSLSHVRDKEANLSQAITACTEALKVSTLAAFPVRYAAIQNNLGGAYWALSDVRDKEANLFLAIAASTEALKVHTLAAFPVQYGVTQNVLAAAYLGLSGVRDKEANLSRTIAALTEALKVFALAAFPMEYAKTQNNLGVAYHSLSGVRDKEANLAKAITAHTEALKVYTLAAFPVDYAKTHSNLGIAYRSLADFRDKEANLAKAEEAFEEEERAYRSEGMVDRANGAHDALRGVQEQMRRGG